MNTKDLQVFQNTEFGQVRVIDIDGQPWFIAKDVADVLGYSNTRDALSRHVDSEDKNTVVFHDGIQGNPNMTIINESGLYSLILSSKLLAAKAFKRWVTSEILPSLRRHGAYITDDTLCRMREDSTFTDELLKRLGEEHERNTSLTEFINRQAPKVRYYDVILQNPAPVQISIIAKDYGVSAIAINKLLHKLGIQFKLGRTWLLYQKYANQGYTVTKTYVIDGGITSVQTCWTQKGRRFIYDTLKQIGILPEAERNLDAAF